MFTFILFILFLSSLLLFIFRLRKIGSMCLCFTIIFYYLNGCGFIPHLLLQPLQSLEIANPIFGKKNMIVLLGGGVVKKESKIMPNLVAYSRIMEATRLYTLCKKSNNACTILISGGDPGHAGQSEAETYLQSLLSLDIPRTHILLEKESLNTFKNAEFTRAILKTTPFDQLFLVTSGIHIKRSLLYFSYFDLHPLPAPADYLAPIFSPLPVGYNFALTDFALHEYIGMMRFYFYNLMGWNKK